MWRIQLKESSLLKQVSPTKWILGNLLGNETPGPRTFQGITTLQEVVESRSKQELNTNQIGGPFVSSLGERPVCVQPLFLDSGSPVNAKISKRPDELGKYDGSPTETSPEPGVIDLTHEAPLNMVRPLCRVFMGGVNEPHHLHTAVDRTTKAVKGQGVRYSM